MKKEGVMIEKVFLLIFGVILLSSAFVFGAHNIFIPSGNITTSLNFNETNASGTNSYIYNISINNTDTNVSESIQNVTIYLPSSFTYILNSNSSTSVINCTFSNSSLYVLNWVNTTTGFINGTVLVTNFSFNATGSIPGVYNITVITDRVIANGTTNTSSAIQVTINDTTAPTVIAFDTVGLYTNGINLSQNSIPINASVTDEGLSSSTITGKWPGYVNITLYNYTSSENVTHMNSSLNSSNVTSWFINFTGLVDGDYMVNITVNDTQGNTNSSIVLNITLDTVDPVITSHTCDRTQVNVGEVITCTCTSTDARTGVSSTSNMDTPPTASIGTFGASCSAVDYAGNNQSDVISYTVYTSSAAPGTGGSGSETVYTKRYIITDEEFKAGYTNEISKNEKVEVKVGGITHNVGVTALSATTATISIFSTPQAATLTIGDVRRFDVNDDAIYDISVKLESIENNKAKVTITSISEAVTAETIAQEKDKEEGGVVAKEVDEGLVKETSSTTIWIIIGVIVVLVLVGIGYKIKKK